MKTITVEDLPRWHVLHDGLAVMRGLSAAEREGPLKVIEYHVRVSSLGGDIPVCGYIAAVLAARALVHTAAWPTVAFALRAAHNPDLFRAAAGGPSIEGSAVVKRLLAALWSCGQADAFAESQPRKMKPWVDTLVLAHCVGALEARA